MATGRGTCEGGFTCPFHGWCYGPDGHNTGIPRRRTFSEHNLAADDLDLTPVRCETWGGCAWINLDPDAPPLRECLEPFATNLDAWKVESLRTEWWYACRLPVNWKLAIEAFVEAYHVPQTHPQLVIPTRYGLRPGEEFDPAAFVDADIRYLREMSEGMAGMVHADDVRIAEGLRDLELPADPDAAMAAWNRSLNDAVTRWHRDRGADIPDLNELAAQGLNVEFFQGFANAFVLPMYSSASAYRFRPLGPEETLMEIWSLTRPAAGEERAVPDAARDLEPRRPSLAAHPGAGLLEHPPTAAGPPRPRVRVHAPVGRPRGAHLELRADDRRLPGRASPTSSCCRRCAEVNVYPFDRPIVDLGS